MSIWNKRGKFPEDFTDTRGLFVYQFDDGVDVEEYDEAFIYASNLIRWCRWNDLVYLEKENNQQQAEIDRLRKGIEELETALETIVWLCESSPSIESIKQNALSALGGKK